MKTIKMIEFINYILLNESNNDIVLVIWIIIIIIIFNID
jgi:hypothetical protein